ncbi:MAG: N-acetylmuramoyl-L-alanine amidase CwlD [Tumebacillaceae bacterium]
MWKRSRTPVWRFAVVVVFFLVGITGLYVGINNMMTEPSSLSWTLPLQGQVIAIDAGHGGVDPGAVSSDGILEKDVTLQVAMQLRDLLQQAGAHVLMIREDDRDLADDGTKGYSRRKSEDLKERATQVRESDAGMLISLHCNALPDPQWSGAQTFYNDSKKESKELATSIQAALRETMGMTRTVKQQNDIYLLKRAEKTSALVELGFLSNPEEAKLLTQKEHQQKLALSIYKGIISYYDR